MEILSDDLMVYILTKTVKSVKFCESVTGSVLLRIGGDMCRRRSIWVSASVFTTLQAQIPHMMRVDLGGNKPKMPECERDMMEHFYRRFNLSFINTCRVEFFQGNTTCNEVDENYDCDDDFCENGEVFVSPSKLFDILSTTP